MKSPVEKIRALFARANFQRKLTLIVMLSSSVALLLACAGFVSYELLTFRQSLLRDISSEASLIGEQSAASLVFDRPDEAAQNLDVLRVRPHIVSACLYRNGRVFATYTRDAGASEVFPPASDAVSHRFTGGDLLVFQPILSSDQPVGSLYLRSDLGEVRSRLTRYAGIAALVLMASFLVSWFVSSRLQRVVSEPVRHLAETAREVSEKKNYALRAVKHGEDELGALIDGFNEMLGQIQARDGELQSARDGLEVRVQERTRDLSQQMTRIGLLNEITYAVAARQDLASIVAVLLRELEDRLPVDYASFYFFDAEKDCFKLVGRGPKAKPMADEIGMTPELPVGDTPFRPAISGEIVYVPDVSKVALPLSQRAAAAGMRACVGAPLVAGGTVLGLLTLVRRTADSFSPAELEFIRGLSAHVALAAHQARLYEDLQKAYEDVRQTQDAVMQQQRLQALGQMTSGIAHDINNALSPVVAYADLLAVMEPNLTDNSRRILKLIKTSGEDIAQIVARLREFYRPRDEREPFAPIHISQLAQEVIELTRPRWRDMPQSQGVVIQMKTEFGSNLPRVNGIASELREALTNLVLNAVDAMPGGGVITLRTRVHAWRQGAGGHIKQHVVFEIVDNGIGMDDQTRRRCLEPFFSTKGKRGTGLGLAMVFGAMQRHNAAIEVDSHLGRGTTMRLVFSVDEAMTESAGERKPGAPGSPLHILCVDDEPLIRQVMKELLEADGHTAETADGGLAGVEAFRGARQGEKPFDLVITDLGMPHLDGRQVANIIKKESPGTPVIMLTGWGAIMKDDGDMPAQVDGLLSKPPRIGELREMLAKCGA